MGLSGLGMETDDPFDRPGSIHLLCADFLRRPLLFRRFPLAAGLSAHPEQPGQVAFFVVLTSVAKTHTVTLDYRSFPVESAWPNTCTPPAGRVDDDEQVVIHHREAGDRHGEDLSKFFESVLDPNLAVEPSPPSRKARLTQRVMQ